MASKKEHAIEKITLQAHLVVRRSTGAVAGTRS